MLFDQRAAEERASTDVGQIARARRTQGAVDTLLVDIDEKVPGFVDDGAVTFADDDAISYGIVDEIAKAVLLTGGAAGASAGPAGRQPGGRHPPRYPLQAQSRRADSNR